MKIWLATTAATSLALGLVGGLWLGAPRPGTTDGPPALLTRLAAIEGGLARVERRLDEQTRFAHDGRVADASGLDAARLEAALHGTVRSELAALLATSTPDAGAAPADERVPSPSERERAFELAHETVLSAVARRRWSEEDRDALHEALRDLSAAQRQEVVGSLVAAANQGELELEPDMLPH